jgi:bifunctional DNA-binding transcriptional regulator/antitoxin component of YhaV-PrlF toxin-antitoxin module
MAKVVARSQIDARGRVVVPARVRGAARLTAGTRSVGPREPGDPLVTGRICSTMLGGR